MEGVGLEIMFGVGEQKDWLPPLNSIKRGEGCSDGVMGVHQQLC